MRQALLVAVISLGAVLATRLPARSEHLFSWDSVNFALAMQRIDLDQHQPHPPGYFGYVMAARALRGGAPENAALVRVNIAAAAVTLLLLWWLVFRVTRSREASAVGWTILLTSPLHWFYTGIGEIYVLETLVTLAIAAAAYACILYPHERRMPWLLGASVAFAALCKLPAAALMAPLVAYAAYRTAPANRWSLAAALACGASIALVAISSLAPLDSVFQLSTEQFESVSRTSAFGGLRLRALNRTARDVAYAIVAAGGVGGLAAIGLCRVRNPNRPTAFLAIWAAPYLATCLLVHFAKPGYALPLLPPLAVSISAGLALVPRRRALVAIAMIAGLNAAQFALTAPWAPERTGGGMRYAAKTAAQKMRTELNSILRPSLYAIRENDARVTGFLEAAGACGTDDTAVLVWTDAPVSWRHAMFYLPAATVIQVPDARAGWLIGRDRQLQDASSGDMLMLADCTVLVREHEIVRTRDPFEIRAGRDGRLLRVETRRAGG